MIFFAKIVFLQSNIQTFAGYAVAPYVGAWIETITQRAGKHYDESHPMWVRGLKLLNIGITISHLGVAPYVGAWIETSRGRPINLRAESRTLCGCVD